MEIGDWTGTASATIGARMTIPNESVLGINLFGDGENEVSGWNPGFTPVPPKLSAEVTGSAEAFAQAGVEVSANGLGKGFAVSLDLRMPSIRADFSALASTEGVCGTNKTLGVDLRSTINAELNVNAALNEDAPFFTQTLFEQELGTLFDQCFPFGPEGDGTGEGTIDAGAGGDGIGIGSGRGKGKGKGKSNDGSRPTGKDEPPRSTGKDNTASPSRTPELSDAASRTSSISTTSGTASQTQSPSSGFATSTLSGSSVSSSGSSSSSNVGSPTGFIPRPTVKFDTCDLIEIDCYGNFEDFEGLSDLPGLYIDAPIPEIPEGVIPEETVPEETVPEETVPGGTNSTQTNQTETLQARSDREYRSILSKRDRKYKPNIGGTTITIESLGYPAPGDLFHTGSGIGLPQHGFTYNSDNDVSDFRVKDAYTRPTGRGHGFVVEHIIEVINGLQVLRD